MYTRNRISFVSKGDTPWCMVSQILNFRGKFPPKLLMAGLEWWESIQGSPRVVLCTRTRALGIHNSYASNLGSEPGFRLWIPNFCGNATLVSAKIDGFPLKFGVEASDRGSFLQECARRRPQTPSGWIDHWFGWETPAHWFSRPIEFLRKHSNLSFFR